MPWRVLATVCVPVFVGALDLTVVSAALPAVIFELGIPLQSGLGEASWVVSGYLLTYALGIVLFGRASDLVGRRSAFVAALALFAFGSWVVAIAHETPAALVAEAVRAVGWPAGRERRRALRGDRRTRDPRLRGGCAGTGGDGARRRSLPRGTPRVPARPRRRGGYRGVGPGAPLGRGRRAGAPLAGDLLDQPSDHGRGARRRVAVVATNRSTPPARSVRLAGRGPRCRRGSPG